MFSIAASILLPVAAQLARQQLVASPSPSISIRPVKERKQRMINERLISPTPVLGVKEQQPVEEPAGADR